MRRAAARSRDQVPIGHERWIVRPAGARICEDDGEPVNGGEIDALAGRRDERERRHISAREMCRPSVVFRNGKVGGKGVDVVGSSHTSS
jgi:hypothetical protein